MSDVFKLFFKSAFARCYIRIKGGNRELSWLIFEVIMPLFGVTAVVYTYAFLGAPEEFVGFVILGGAMFSYWANVLWGIGMNFYWEKEDGNLEKILITPAPLQGILLGITLGGMFNTTVRAVATLILGIIIFRARFNPNGVFPTLIVFILTIFALYSLGMCFASLFLKLGRSGWRLTALMEEPVMFLSGQYYPIKVLPVILQAVASLIPITIGIDGVRQSLILGASLFDLRIHLALLSVIGVSMFLLSYNVLKWMERKGKEDGSLTMRWM
ncbi:MAG: ABC transporter permease [Thermoproteota archaeon]